MGNSPHIWVLLIVLGFSFFSWVYRQLKEQQAKRAAREAAVRREEALLRTGRETATAMPAASPSRSAAASEPAGPSLAERQARLRALQSGTPTPAAPAPAPGATGIPPGMRQIELWPGGPRVLIPAAGGTPGAASRAAPSPSPAAPASPAPRRAASPMPAPAPARAAPSGRSKRGRPAKQASAAPSMAEARAREAREQALAEQRRRDVLTRSEEAPATPTARRAAVASGPSPAPFTGAPTTPAQWRQALILSEILSPPLSVRRPEE